MIGDLFYEEDRLAAETYLDLVSKHQNRPEQLNIDDYRNALDSFQWCYDNEEWRMIINFVVCLRGFFDQRNRWPEGIYCIECALKACDELKETGIRAQLYFDLGLLQDRQGLLSDAETQYNQSAKLAFELKQEAVLADALHRLGWIAHSRQAYLRAEILYCEAKSLREDMAQSSLAISRSWHQLGILAQDRRDYDRAKRFYEKALLLREEALQQGLPGALSLKAASLYQLGALEAIQKNWSAALTHFEETRAIRRDLHDQAGESDVLDQLGSIAYQQQKWGEAYEFYKDCLSLKESVKDYKGTVRVKIHLGEVRLKQNNLEEAQSWFQHCLEDLEKDEALKDDYLESQIYSLLGQILFFMDDYEAAIPHYEKSLELLANIDGKQSDRAGILYQLGLSAFELGFKIAQEGHQDDQARNHFYYAYHRYLACLAIQEQENLLFEAAKTHFQLGMVYQVHNIYGAARDHYEASRKIFAQEGHIEFQTQAIYRLGNIAELSGHVNQAFGYYQEAINLCQLHNIPPMDRLQEALDQVRELRKNESPKIYRILQGFSSFLGDFKF